jgi:heme oxygenase
VKKHLRKKIDDILLSAIENRLEQYTRQILKLEEKYGVSFKEFEQMWDRDKIKNKYSYEVESDFIDWEMLEMEKKDLISALSRLKSLKKR